MRHSTPRPIRLAIALAAGSAMALTACGSDDDSSSGGGSVEAFCSELEGFAADTGDAGDPTFVEDFRALAESAPSEIADEVNQMLSAFEQIDALPDEPGTEEEMNELLELASSIEEPGAAIEEFALENCPGLPDSVFGG